MKKMKSSFLLLTVQSLVCSYLVREDWSHTLTLGSGVTPGGAQGTRLGWARPEPLHPLGHDPVSIDGTSFFFFFKVGPMRTDISLFQ